MPRIDKHTVEFTLPGNARIWRAEFSHQHARESCPHIDPSRGVPKHVRLKCSHYDVKGRPAHQPWECPQARLIRFCPEPKIEGVLWKADALSAPIHVRHITTVKLRYKDQPTTAASGAGTLSGGKASTTFLRGCAPCSLLDQYDWQKGVKLAMQRALEKGGYCRLGKIEKCPHLHIAGTGPIHKDKSCPLLGRITLVESKPTYGLVMSAFWRAMRERVPAAPAGRKIPITTGDIPTHGLGAVEDDSPVDAGTPPPELASGTYHLGAD